jgi:hypothetical protein
MNNKIISPVALLLVIGVMPRIGLADAGLLRTSYPLDDARGYCIDIAGFGANIRLDDPLLVHTCKYGASLEEQIFEPVGGRVAFTRLAAIGTADTGVSAEIVDFIQRTIER